MLTQFGANFISQLIASISNLSKARVAAENIVNVIKENAVDMNNLSDEGLRPVWQKIFFKKLKELPKSLKRCESEQDLRKYFKAHLEFLKFSKKSHFHFA